MKFNRIGYAREFESKRSGKRGLRLLIDPGAIRQMADKDIKERIYLFPNNTDGKDKGYIVNAPTPEDYKLDHNKLFEKPQQKPPAKAEEHPKAAANDSDLPF